ncbi:MAG: nuclear transport factor 2 family protein [Armatimonadota bacterium]
MKKAIIALLLVIGVFMVCGCTQKVDIAAETAQVKAVLDQNLKATENEDINLLGQVYSQGPEVMVIGTAPGEEFVGWATFSEAMNKQFEKFDNVKLNVRNQIIKVHESGKVAWFWEVVDFSADVKYKEAEMDKDTKEVKEVEKVKPVNFAGVRFTGILEKTKENKWVVVQSHMSVPAVEQIVVEEVEEANAEKTETPAAEPTPAQPTTH